MLDALQRLASWMRPAAPLLGILGLALLLLCGGLILFAQGATGDQLLLPAIAALAWCLCGYVFIHVFQQVPAFPDADLRGWRRLTRLFARAWHWLLALVFLGTTIGALMITNRIIGEALG